MSNKILPSLTIKLCKYAELASNSIVINPSELDFVIHLVIPDELSYARPIEMREITVCDVDGLDFVKFSPIHNRPWIDVRPEDLNLVEGYHKYKVRFCISDEIVYSYYFSYVIQREDPAKPYMYMQRGA